MQIYNEIYVYESDPFIFHKTTTNINNNLADATTTLQEHEAT